MRCLLSVLVWGLTASLILPNPARAAEPRYQLHFLAVSCFIGPCPDWQVTDTSTGEQFVAAVDFNAIARPPVSSNDLLIEARRIPRERPKGGGSYDELTVSAIITAVPSIPGYRP
jgi:hypothetical protein